MARYDYYIPFQTFSPLSLSLSLSHFIYSANVSHFEYLLCLLSIAFLSLGLVLGWFYVFYALVPRCGAGRLAATIYDAQFIVHWLEIILIDCPADWKVQLQLKQQSRLSSARHLKNLIPP